MKVKEKYSARDGFDLTTAQLIDEGAGGREDALEARLSHLTKVVAALIDRSGISGAELLEITGCEWRYKVATEGDYGLGRK